MSADPEQLARFAHVEPPPALDAWVRSRLEDAVAARARRTPAPAHSTRARVPQSIPLAERVALAVGFVACSVQASGFVLRWVWSALGR